MICGTLKNIFGWAWTLFGWAQPTSSPPVAPPLLVTPLSTVEVVMWIIQYYSELY